MPTSKDTIAENIPSPKENPYFIGHEFAAQQLQESFTQKKLAKSWLISGPRGIGKATLSYRFARFILSGIHNSNMSVPSTNPTFSKIKSGSHSDLLSLETGYNAISGKISKEIIVDDVRNAISFLRLTASETSYRVVIIDSVDDMNINAANSLLKILEEPPTNALLLLISHAPGKILPTIRSRCRHLKLSMLSNRESKQVIQTVLPDINDTVIDHILILSDYSPGRAVELFHHDILGIYSEILSLFEHIGSPNNIQTYEIAEKLIKKNDENTWHCTIYLISWFLTKIIRHSLLGSTFQPIDGTENSIMQLILSKYPLEKLIQIWEKMDRVFQASNSKSLDKKAVFVTVFGYLCDR